MSADIAALKAALRQEALKRRKAMHEAVRHEASVRAARHFFDNVELVPGACVGGYWPIRDELDVRLILGPLMDRIQPLALPVVEGPELPLRFRRWEDGAPLVEAGFGSLAPGPEAMIVVPDLLLVPVLGFDRLGTRLGYGGGYYDRTVAAMAVRPRLIGLAFARQEFDQLPALPHDMRLDAVVTEAGFRRF